ncbi:hypothetical protein BHM03_00010525 [Ensete ventricosum]|uniref:Uncharacterized protein n=1 Tax=Ensete ventricosum TaxID=4639 RepID=A0A445MD52_ENSVE|nr:hypothetical protein BHM03_00010525 [Ensete ventricosum]
MCRVGWTLYGLVDPQLGGVQEEWLVSGEAVADFERSCFGVRWRCEGGGAAVRLYIVTPKGMAVVMTTGAGGDEQQQQHQNPFFLDFLGMGMSSGGQTPAPGSRSMAGDAEHDAASPSASWQTLGVSTAGQHGIVPATSLLDSGPLSFVLANFYFPFPMSY